MNSTLPVEEQEPFAYHVLLCQPGMSGHSYYILHLCGWCRLRICSFKHQVESGDTRVMRLWQSSSTGIPQEVSSSAAPRRACKVSTIYVPSDLEQAWLTNAKNWSHDFCSNMVAHNPAVNVWVNTLTRLTSLQPQHRTAVKSPAQVHTVG
jgi:hypothetical protein